MNAIATDINILVQTLNTLFDKVETFLNTVNRDEYITDGYLRIFHSLEPYSDEPEDVLPTTLTNEYIELLDIIQNELCGSLITNEGLSSRAFYLLKNYGFSTTVIEQDSFGPLSCAVKKLDYDWRVAYG
jgi:hypothetical protein